MFESDLKYFQQKLLELSKGTKIEAGILNDLSISCKIEGNPNGLKYLTGVIIYAITNQLCEINKKSFEENLADLIIDLVPYALMQEHNNHKVNKNFHMNTKDMSPETIEVIKKMIQNNSIEEIEELMKKYKK